MEIEIELIDRIYPVNNLEKMYQEIFLNKKELEESALKQINILLKRYKKI